MAMYTPCVLGPLLVQPFQVVSLQSKVGLTSASHLQFSKHSDHLTHLAPNITLGVVWRKD